MIKLNEFPVQFQHYHDGACRFTIPYKNIYEQHNVITWLYENDEEILHLYYLANHVKNVSSDIQLLMPYVNSARQDRTQNEDDVFTLKYFCNLINSLNFNKVYVFDPHSPVSAALLNNVSIMSPKSLLDELFKRLPPDVIVGYCDAGAEKRYNSLLQKPYVVGYKERDWKTGQIRKLEMYGDKDKIINRPILLIDDIISRGTTMYLAAKQLKERGADKIYIYASHCENTVLDPHIDGQSLLEVPNLIEKIFTTNSILTKTHKKIEIIGRF